MVWIEAKFMAYKFRDYDLEQPFLIAPDIRDWVPEDHLARFIDEAVSVLDLTSFKQTYRAGRHGRAAYDPAMMLRVVLYCFCSGIFSSRRMEQAAITDIGARFLAANERPDHTSFFKFHKRHRDNIKGIFVQIVGLCREMGLQRLGHVAIDGTLIKANSSKSKCVEIAKLDEIIARDTQMVAEMLAKWKATDDSEKDTKEIPKELRSAKSRLRALNKAKEHVDRLLREKHEAELETIRAEKQAQYESEKAHWAGLQPEGAPDLQAARVQRGLSQAQLAEEVGIDRRRISKLELGGQYPSPEESEKFTSFLGPVYFLKTPADSVLVRKCKLPKAKLPPKAKVNLTEPECPLIKRRGKPAQQAYNAQYAVDSEYQIIVGLGISTHCGDHANFVPMMKEVINTNDGRKPRQASGDCGYYSLEAIESSVLEGIDVCVPPQKLKTPPQNPHPTTQRMLL
jgi:transposase/transcriptional regulator with XRE-family HTH domain